MIALSILLALLALILFILFVNIHVIFTYGEGAKVTVRVLFLRFDGMKLFRRFTKEKSKPKKKRECRAEEWGTKGEEKCGPSGLRRVSFAYRSHHRPCLGRAFF